MALSRSAVRLALDRARLLVLEGKVPELRLPGGGLPVLLFGAVAVIAMAIALLHYLFPPIRDASRRTNAPRGKPRRCPVRQRELDEEECPGARMDAEPHCKGHGSTPAGVEGIADKQVITGGM